jgi:glutathione synthase/RimK-type ligase-like ATP-grasp enzyme
MSGDAMHEPRASGKPVAKQRRVALVTAREAQSLDEDLPPLTDALHHAGVDVEVVPWDAARDWSHFDMLLLRSTWDYMSRLAEFLSWAERAAQATTLVNSLATVRWNIDKHYLGTLEAAGVPVVPTTFLEPGADAAAALERFLGADRCAEFVIKPAIGAGSRDAERHGRHARAAALGHAQRLLAAGRSILVQPYLARVDEEGEAALIFFGGEFSHSIRKGALLRPGAGATTELFAPESISARAALADELEVARRALAAVPFPAPLYARVDLIRAGGGAPLLLELELIEPSLFFGHAPGAAARFAECIRGFVSAATVPL